MANVEAWGSRPAGGVPPGEGYVEELFRGRYLEMVRLAGPPVVRRRPRRRLRPPAVVTPA